MTSLDRWEKQPGGLYLAVSPFAKANPEHQDAALNVMRNSVQKIAQVHGASFSEKGFRNNMQALYSGDIKLDLFLAKWEICQPAALCLGAALHWDTVGIDENGRNRRAIYTEDVCLLNEKLRPLISGKPDGKEFPEESLAECFERISLQNMLLNGIAYRYGEVDRENTKMMRSLYGNGAIIGTGPDSAVLEFKSIPPLLDRWPMDVKVISLKKDGIRDENKFVVRWHDGQNDFRLIVTKGQATALGHARADIIPWHNGRLPPQEILECVMAASLRAIKHEVETVRQWGAQPGQGIPGPNIRILAEKSEIFVDLYQACGNELNINAAERPGTFDKPMPDAHIFVTNDQSLLDGFVAIGAEQRVFGGKPMIPGVNILRNEVALTV